MTKKILITLILLTVVSCLFEFIEQPFIFAQTDLDNAINNQLKDLNIENLDNVFKNLNNNFSFKEFFNSVLSGEFNFNGTSILNYIFTIFKASVKDILAPFIFIFIICVLGYILKNSTSEKVSSSTSNVVHLGLISIIAVIIIKLIFSTILNSKLIFISLKKIMEITFPIILTLMATSGAKASVSIYQPIMAILSGGIIELFINFLLPIFIVVIVLTVADSLTDNVKLSNLSNLLSKIYKWTLGIVFGVFSSLLAVFGITAGSYDTITFKTAQYSIKNYIPFVGSYLSGGFNIIACASVLIKNSIGLAAFIMVLVTILKPILNILIIKLFLGLLSAILQNIADKKIINFCLAISKALNMLIAIICVITAMFLIFISLCIASGNVI